MFRTLFRSFSEDINRGYERQMSYDRLDRYTLYVLGWHFIILLAFIVLNAVIKISLIDPSPFSWRVITPIEAIVVGIIGFCATFVPYLVRSKFKSHYAWRVLIVACLTIYSYLFVFISGGAIEMHFHFFLIILFVSIYADWRLGWISFFLVLIHHTILNYLEPHWVFFYGENALSPFAHAIPILVAAIFSSYLSRTHRQALLNQIEEEQAKDEFISAASHELKTPITSQKLFINMLEKVAVKDGNTNYLEYINKIAHQTNSLELLIHELLDVTKIEQDKAWFEQVEIKDISKDLRAVIKDFQKTTENHEIVIKGTMKGKICGDRERICQVLTNLISNAIRFSPMSSRIVITFASTAKELSVSVKDYGIGIDELDQAKIFEKFYRVGGSQGTRFPGMGIGLYICSEIIKRHNGTLSVESIKGKGSTFTFTLPRILEQN